MSRSGSVLRDQIFARDGVEAKGNIRATLMEISGGDDPLEDDLVEVPFL